MKKENKNKIMILVFLLLLLVVVGATYAFFAAQRGSGGSAQIEVGAGTTDSLQFTSGNKINIVATQDNFQKDGDNQRGNSRVTATLTPNNTTKEAKDMYNVYLVIEDNEFIYTTEAHEAELVLKVVNPASTEVTSMNAVKYVDEVGFDITELKSGIYPIVKGYDIEANGEPKEDNWEITVTLINLDQDQNKNAGKSFTGKVYITKDDLRENDLIKVNSITSTTTTNTINVDLKIGQEIGKVDKYYFAIEETKESPGDIQMESVASALAKEYEESPTATYAFTTINEEPLKASQNYKIYGYGVDTKGFRSNIYETIVTTDEYQIPTIETVSHEETENSTTLTITGNGGTSNISKYQYSIDNNNWVDTSDATGTITIPDLEYNKSYDVRIRAVDEQGRYSNIWVENIKIIKLGTEEYPYEIKTVEDLVKLSTEVNGGNPHIGEYYKLENDIDFQNEDSYENGTIDSSLTEGEGFAPIGNYQNKGFRGIFDGNGKAINNLYINNTTNNYVALFGNISNATIKNLTIEGEIKSTIASDVGGLVGRLANSTIDSCISKINIVKTDKTLATGGIVAFISAQTTGKIINSENYGNLQYGTNMGGIVGYSNFGSNVEIINCKNKGNIISSSGGSAGGIIGFVNSDENNISNLTIESSTNEGQITFDSSVKNSGAGGIVGKVYSNVLINNSHNLNTINSESLTTTEHYTVGLGGIAGYVYSGSKIKITNASNNGEINGGNSAGGIVGDVNSNSTVWLDKCVNNGNISANLSAVRLTDVGGLIGYLNEAYGYVLNSVNNGIISMNEIDSDIFKNAAGIVGFVANVNAGATIINSYNVGMINSLNTKLSGSGIFNFANTADKKIYLNNVYNNNDITEKNSFAYLNALPIDIEFNNCYYKNTGGGSNLEAIENYLTPLKPEQINNLENLSNQKNFLDTLNENVTNISLKDIDESLTDYELVNWKQGSDGYPILDYQNE